MPVKDFRETPLRESLLIEPRVFDDDRGFFMEIYHRDHYSRLGIERLFVQDNLSHSCYGTLRGLHYQQRDNAQDKLVMCITGKIFDVAVDIRTNSNTFGKSFSAFLSEENRKQLYVPRGFAHGFFVVSETATVLYKCTDIYTKDAECGILWSDPTLKIKWPEMDPKLAVKSKKYPILSTEDSTRPLLADIPDDLLF